MQPEVMAVESGFDSGCLIVNADDWGRDSETTERILECVRHRTISSVSAMVFMEDSERASATARERAIDVGLHLNLTTPFSVPGAPKQLVEHQQRLSQYLRQNRLAQAVFHPGLTRSFEYVVAAQLEEFSRLYGGPAARIDGHHHMHLCANVVLRNLLPTGTVVRRNFSFRPGEKSLCNRLYRRVVDNRVARSHRMADLFFSLAPLEPHDRLQRIFAAARRFVVEVETHPIEPEEYGFLTGDRISALAGKCQIAPRFVVSSNGNTARWY
jgi:predicted glycoside hydrolase/deacetylase ChbG (UPF0249 family)